jgi:hypothetical protein
VKGVKEGYKLFEKLSRGSVYERFTFDDKSKLKYMNCVTRQTQFTPVDQHKGPFIFEARSYS